MLTMIQPLHRFTRVPTRTGSPDSKRFGPVVKEEVIGVCMYRAKGANWAPPTGVG